MNLMSRASCHDFGGVLNDREKYSKHKYDSIEAAEEEFQQSLTRGQYLLISEIQ